MEGASSSFEPSFQIKSSSLTQGLWVGLDDSSADTQHEKNLLPESWNEHSPNSFAFRYRHDQSSLVYLLKAVKLSKRLVIHGIALEVRPTSSDRST